MEFLIRLILDYEGHSKNYRQILHKFYYIFFLLLAGGTASGDEAYLILDNRNLRNKILDELNELSTFCKMRSLELSHEKSFFLNDSLMNSGDENANTWNKNHNDINELIEILNGPGMIRTLHLVKTSSTFVNRIVEEMKHKLQVVSRLEDKVRSKYENCPNFFQKNIIIKIFQNNFFF